MRLLAFVLLLITGSVAPAETVTSKPSRLVVYYALTSASEFDVYDPTDWRLLGSNDEGKTWTTIDVRTNQLFSLRCQRRVYATTNQSAYNIYRFQVDRIRDPSYRNVQLGDLELIGKVMGTTNEPDLQIIATASRAHPLMGPAENAFDHDPTTKWMDFGLGSTNGCWLQCQYAYHSETVVTNVRQLRIQERLTATRNLLLNKSSEILSNLASQATTPVRALSGYALTSANDFPGRDPRDWRLLGSNDGGKSWDTLDVRHDEIFSTRFQRRVFNLANQVAYALYRLEIDATSVTNTLTLQVSEIEPLYASRENDSRYSLAVLAGGENPPMEAADMAFDHEPKTKWLVYYQNSTNSPYWLQWQYLPKQEGLPVINLLRLNRLLDRTSEIMVEKASQVLSNLTAQVDKPIRTIKAYALTSANDYELRDPTDWQLLGSNDEGKTWEVLDARHDQVFKKRFERRIFTLKKPAAFKLYRLQIDRVVGSGNAPIKATSVQLGEIEPLYAPGEEKGQFSTVVSARGENPPAELAEMAFDGDPVTKWLDYSPGNTNRASWIQWEYSVVHDLPVVNVEHLRSLKPRVAQILNLNLEGVAVSSVSASNTIAFLDRTGFQMFELGDAISPVQPGDRIQLTGQVQFGKTFPLIQNPRIILLGRSAIIPQIEAEQSFPEYQGFVLSTAEGRVKAVAQDRFYTTLRLSNANQNGELLAKIPNFNHLHPADLIDSRVKVQGLVEPVFDAKGRHVPGVLWLASLSDMTMLPPTDGEWNALPLFINDASASTNAPYGRHVRIRGTLSWRQAENSWVVAQGTNQVLVHFNQPVSFPANSLVETVGTLTKSNGDFVLGMAFIRAAAANAPGFETAESSMVDDQHPITEIREIYEEIKRHPDKTFPVRVRGVITYIDLGLGDFYLQNGSDSIVVHEQMSAGLCPFLHQEGMYVELQGSVYASNPPGIFPEAFVQVLGKAQMPQPVKHSWGYLMTGKDDGQWVELEGVVYAAEEQRLTLFTKGGQLIAWVNEIDPSTRSRLVGSYVRIDGVCSPVVNNRNQRLGLRLLVPSEEYIEILSAAPENPFDLPLLPISGVMQLDSRNTGLNGGFVKTAGTVTYKGIDQLFVQNGNDGLRVLLRKDTSVEPGDQVEVVGLAERDGFSPKLVQALVRKVGRSPLPTANPIEPLRLNSDDEETSSDATRGKIEATFLGYSLKQSLVALELRHETSKKTFLAFLPANKNVPIDFPVGSRLRLTGVFKAEADTVPDFGQVLTSFEMYLNSPSDIQVLERPPWWNLRHTLFLFGGLGVVLVVSLIWAESLRKQVRQRTRELQEEVVQRRRAQEDLLESQVLYRSLVEHLPACIFRKQADGAYVFVNSNFCHLMGLKSEQIIGKKTLETSSGQVVVKELEDHQSIMQQSKTIELEEQYHTADGRTQNFRVLKSPVFGSDGRIVGTQGMMLDITAIKQAEIKLEQLHRKLMESSRMAGMAEVATSVLHNVGNVLNSVNISSSLITEKVRSSKVVNLAKAAALLQAHSADLSSFFVNDPKGRQLPVYLSDLAAHLIWEHEEMTRELSLLSNNIEHIKEIVSMQQSYAKVAGVHECLPVVDLVEDALRMNEGGLSRHQIRVVRDYRDTPTILVEKHKVLQILVNLMRNAKHALEDSGTTDKCLTLQVELNGEERVKIVVIDNGIGISAANLRRLFEHGFTTRKQGHGFGLHNGALAARELGGSLTVHSDGPGKGAAFTLEFPCQPPAKTS
jgi:PAS domain S-box-containing protein